MCDESATNSFEDGDVVWVKVSNRWWPAEICSDSRVPQELLDSKRKKPKAIVKFFQEDTYEFIKDLNHLMIYNCPKKIEFIKKGLELYRANNKHMEKFPSDVQTAEKITGGDENILESVTELEERKKLNYSEIFGDSSKKSKKPKNTNRRQSISGRSAAAKNATPKNSAGKKKNVATPLATPKIETQDKRVTLKANYKRDVPNHESKIMLLSPILTPQSASVDSYKCHLCNFTSSRQNVIILHTKSHTNPTPLVTILSETDSGKRNSDGGGILKSPSGLLSNTSKYASVIVIDDSEDSDEDTLKQVEEPETCVEDENVKKVNEKEIRVETPKPIEIEENDYGVEESMVIVCDKRKIPEEIRTEILADWSDEASGSDSDNSPTMNIEKRILEDVENSLKDIERSQSPLDQPEPIRLGEELAQLMINKESSESSTDDKVSSSSILEGRNSPKKYRNIPKKDRRAIVLKDFNNVDVLNEKNNAPKDEENFRQSIDELSKIEEEMSNSCKEIEQQDDNKIELESQQPDELTLSESTPIEIDIPVQNEPPPQIDKPVQNALPPENETPAAQNEPLDLPEKCTQHESPHKEIPKIVKKSAISCFDFQDEEEDEDFFTSLSKLKKKYLSPDKNKDTIENRLLGIDHFKETEIEKKDEQLTADIENLLNYTKLPEIKLDDKELIKPSTSNTDVVLREVRTLPPKERGKRIFKSRNRSRFEEAVTLTSSIETLKTNTTPVTWPPAQKKEVETVSEKILSFDCTGVTTNETNNLSPNVSITSKSVESSEIINTTIKEAIIISNTKIPTENATESKVEMKTEDQETNFETITSLESGQVDIIHPEVDLKSDAQISACNTELLEKNHDNDDGKQGCKDNIELKIQGNDENNRIILESHTMAVKPDVNISAAVIPESMTQSELAVAEALISIPNAFELSTTINESTISEINSESSVKDEVDLIEQKTITIPEENTELTEVNKPSPEEETPQVIKNGNSLEVVKEQTENLKIVDQQQTQNETSSPTIAQQTEKEDKSEKPTWVGTRKRRRAHMKNTPRKIVIVSSTIIGPPDGSSSSTDNGEKSSFKGSSVTCDVMETETVDTVNQEASQTKILKLEESLEINISIPDKLSDLEEVPRPQFSPLSPQIPYAKTDQKFEQTDENLSTSNIEMLSSDRQFSPLTPPPPRFSPVRDITEFHEAAPSTMETDQPVQKNTVRSGLSESEPQEETCRINVKSLREQYEESFVQKYIKDAMMFESSSSAEEIKLNINEGSELNTPRQRTELSESMKASHSEESLKIETDTKVENKIAKSSKDTISEIRSFRLRRKNVKCNSDHLDKLKSSTVEIFVSKENLTVPEHMDVDKNLNSMINEINIRNLAEESSVILQADGMTIDKRAIINVDTTKSQFKEVDLEMKKYDGVQNNEIEAITEKIETTNNIKNIKEIESSVVDMTAVQNTEMLDENQTNEINNLQSLEKNVGLSTAAQTLIPTSLEVNNQLSKNPSSESFISSSIVNLKNERKDFRIPKKRKQTFEDDIPSFVIEKPTPAIITITPTTSAHPPEKITKLDTTSITESKEMIKSNKTNNSKSGESFDIHNMPILLASDALVGSQSIATENVEKVQLIVASRTQGVISCEAIPTPSPPLTSTTVTVPPPPPPPQPAQSLSSSTNKTQTHTLTKTSTRGRKIAGQQVAPASSAAGAVVSNNSVTAQNRQTSTTPPMMTHQSSQIITAEGKEIGKDGKGNKFVIIKSGNSNKMIIRPDSPKATAILEQQKSSGSQQNVSTSVSSGSVICTQTLETATKGGAEIFPSKNPTQKGSQVLQQSYPAGQVVITNKGAVITNNSEALTCTGGGNIQMGTSYSSNASGRNSNRRRSSKSNNNTPSTSNFQQGIGRMVIEQQKLLNNKTITQMGKSAMLATKNQELMPPPPAPITKRNDVADMEVERINSSSKGRRSTQSKSHSKYSSRNKIKSEEVIEGGGGAITVPEIQSSVQTNESQKQQQHQILQQTQQIQKIQHQQQLQKQMKQQQQQQQQQQLQQQFHQQQLQQQFQHQQQIQQQQQLQQQQQQQLRQQQEQHAQQQLQQQLHLQQQQQQTQLQHQQQHLQHGTKKSHSKGTLYSHSSEKNNSASIMPESSKLPESITDGKSIINILPITSSNLPPNVEVDESEMGSYVAVQATDPNVFYLCKHQGDDEGLIPVISQPLYLDQNNGTLVLPHQIPIDTSEMETEEKLTAEQDESQMVNVRISDEDSPEQRRILLSIEDNQDNQVVIDYETAVALINNSGGEDPVQLSVNDQLVSISVDTLAHAFGLTVDKETEQFIFTNIDLENSLQNATNPDILAAALAGTEVYQQQEIIGDVLVDPNNVSIVEQGGISFQPIDPQVTAAKATTNETNAILTQPPIMSTLEVPPNKKKTKFNSATQKLNETTGLIGQNLDESLAKIGVTTQSSVVPSSLELPITVTNPAIAPKTTSNPILLEGIYTTGLSQASQMSPPISSAIAHEQQELSYEILTSSSVQSMSSATILNTNTGRGGQQHHHHHQHHQQQQHQQQHHHQQATEFGVVQSPNSVGANVSAYDDPAR